MKIVLHFQDRMDQIAKNLHLLVNIDRSAP